MKKIIGIFFNRITVSVFLLFLQLFWLAELFLSFRENLPWITAATGLAGLIVMLLAVLSDRNPAYKITWLILAGIAPVFGTFLYIIVSNKLPGRSLRRRVGLKDRNMKTQLADLMESAEDRIPDSRLSAICGYIGSQGPYPVHTDTEVSYFTLGEKMFARMLEDLSKAEKFVFFEYFIVAEGRMWDEIKALMKKKAACGVDVRVMFDDLGSLSVLPKNFIKELTEAGIRVIPFNPLVPVLALGMNNRDHRKILVIDGNVGYTGGINIADEYINETTRFGHWKDTGVRLEGSGVANLTAMFLSVWDACSGTDTALEDFLPDRKIKADGFVQPFSDNPLDNELLSETVYMDILWQAQKYVYLFTPYLVIDHEMTVALTAAAKRGVDVRILLPGIPDKKMVFHLAESYFRQLLESGVRIFLYTPGFIHAKSCLSDDRAAVVGTINMDYRSLYLHFECGAFMTGVDAVGDLKKDCLDSFAVSEEVLLENLRPGPLKKLYHAALRIISPLT